MRDDVQDAQAVQRLLLELLAEYGVDTHVEDDLILLSGEADAGPCPGVIECRDLETGDAVQGRSTSAVLVEITYTLPFDPVPRGRVAEMALLLTCLNPDVGLGHFELDPLTREVGFRIARLHTGASPPELLMAPLLEGLNVIDDHAGRLAAVFDGAAAGHVFVDSLLTGYDAQSTDADDSAPAGREAEPGGGLPDATRVALMVWLEQATETYRRADDKARQAQLGPLVRRLFAG